MNSKDQLRKICIERRDAEPDKDIKNEIIFHKLLKCPEIESADLILSYVSVGSEVSTYKFIKHMLNIGKSVAVPRCLINEMKFVKITSFDDLKTGKYGIPEPSSDEEVVLTPKTVCIVPGLAFTEKGVRLGYGGGFYDKFLSHNIVKTIGITYGSLIFDDLPSEIHDVKIEKIISP